MDGKTDKQLVWDAIKEIEKYTAEPYPNFVILTENHWKDLPANDRFRIRGIMLSDGLIQIVANMQWAFQLTSAGMILKESDLKSNGTLKKKNPYKQFWIGVLAALIGAMVSTGLSALLEVWKANNLPQPHAQTIFLPKIQIVHDTIWLKKNSTQKK